MKAISINHLMPAARSITVIYSLIRNFSMDIQLSDRGTVLVIRDSESFTLFKYINRILVSPEEDGLRIISDVSRSTVLMH